jgi:hypothetical protein
MNDCHASVRTVFLMHFLAIASNSLLGGKSLPTGIFSMKSNQALGNLALPECLRAIALVKTLQTENRIPKHSEQLILSKFNGWGAMWQVFKPEHPQNGTLKSLLTPAEFRQANASVLNAYYTNPEIVKTVWNAVKQLAFKSGKVLEPSCGIGYFLNERADNEWTAVELDPIPAAIAKYLHPTATIYNQGFERTSLPNGYFDLAI